MESNGERKLKQKPYQLGSIWAAFAIILALNYAFLWRSNETIPYSQFLQLVDEGKVANVTISESAITGDLKNPEPKQSAHFTTNPVKDDTLIQKLHDKSISFRSEATSPLWSLLVSWVVPLVLVYLLWTFLFGRMEMRAQGGLFSVTKSRAKIHIEKDVKTTFADVAGIEEAKAELHEAVEFLQSPQKFSRLGGRLPKGILLLGPPGTGKTLLARAVAGEAKVPFYSINGSEFVELFVGVGAARVRDLFDQARQQSPCILFIDEVDALGKSRAFGSNTSGNDEKEQTLNQLLAEMDGFDTSEGVILLAATNRPEILDPALLRAGRFDRQILLTNPDQAGREQILAVHAKKIKLEPGIDLKRIASFTSGFSGADLANLVNEAAIVATRRNADAVAERDFTLAVERIVAGLEKKTKVMSPNEKRRIAYHELGHATVALALNTAEKVHKISVIPRGIGALGYTLQRPTEDRYVLDEEELLDKIAVLLGGRASEKWNLGKISTGAADDLVKATNIARAMITQYGMSERLGLASLEDKRASFLQSEFEFTPRLLSERTVGEVDMEIKTILDKGFRRALACLETNKEFIDVALEQLLKTETLDESEIGELWEKFGHSSSRSEPSLDPKARLATALSMNPRELQS